jgi:large subunit ribosomal protein L24
MAALHIKKNDQVIVLAGRDRGKTGKVLKVLPRSSSAIVENINRVKRHTRPNPSRNIKGGIVEREAPIHVSKVMPLCQGCGKPTRVAVTRLEDGNRIRSCKRCGGSLDRG